MYAYQLHHGVIAMAPGQAVIRHRCDETSCENWDHLLIGTQPNNVRDYRARRGREDGPLADRRGARDLDAARAELAPRPPVKRGRGRAPGAAGQAPV